MISKMIDYKITKIDTSTWERTNHFNFFQARQHPHLCITSNVNITNLNAYRRSIQSAKIHIRLSDMVYYTIISAVNGIDEFKTRIVGGSPVLFETIHAGFTYIPRGRNLHCNCITSYSENFSVFQQNIQTAREEADKNPTLTPEDGDKQNVIYMSNLPNLFFTSLSNPWGDPNEDTVPRILFGKMLPISNDETVIPVSIEVLHSFVDGLHIEKLVNAMEHIASNPETHFKL